MKVGLNLVSYISIFNICIAIVIFMTIVVFIFGIVVSRNPEKQKPVIVAFVCNMVLLVAFLVVVIFAHKQQFAPLMAGLCAILPLFSYFLSSILFKRRREGTQMQDAWGGYQAQGSSLEDLSEDSDAHLLTGFETPQVDKVGEYRAQIPLSNIDKTQPLKPISAQVITANSSGVSSADEHISVAEDSLFNDSVASNSDATTTSNAMNNAAGIDSTSPADTVQTENNAFYEGNNVNLQGEDNSEIIAQARAYQKEQNYSKAAELYAQAAKMSSNSSQQSSLVLDEIICYTMDNQHDKAKKLALELLNSKTLDPNLALQLKEVVDLMA